MKNQHIKRIKNILKNILFNNSRRKISDQIQMIRIFHEKEIFSKFDLNNSFHICHYLPCYLENWITLLNNSNEFGKWDKEQFNRKMLSYLILGTEVLLFDDKLLIGSCACFNLEEYKPYAVLAYPIVLNRYRNKGLGSFLINLTLEKSFELGYPGVLLHTQKYRKAAIKAYKKLGFVPTKKKLMPLY